MIIASEQHLTKYICAQATLFGDGELVKALQRQQESLSADGKSGPSHVARAASSSTQPAVPSIRTAHSAAPSKPQARVQSSGDCAAEMAVGNAKRRKIAALRASRDTVDDGEQESAVPPKTSSHLSANGKTSHSGSVRDGGNKEGDSVEEWTCGFCTLVNSVAADPKECAICGNPRSFNARPKRATVTNNLSK